MSVVIIYLGMGRQALILLYYKRHIARNAYALWSSKFAYILESYKLPLKCVFISFWELISRQSQNYLKLIINRQVSALVSLSNSVESNVSLFGIINTICLFRQKSNLCTVILKINTNCVLCKRVNHHLFFHNRIENSCSGNCEICGLMPGLLWLKQWPLVCSAISLVHVTNTEFIFREEPYTHLPWQLLQRRRDSEVKNETFQGWIDPEN